MGTVGILSAIVVAILLAMVIVQRAAMSRCFGSQYDPDLVCIEVRKLDRDYTMAIVWLSLFDVYPLWYTWRNYASFKVHRMKAVQAKRDAARREWVVNGVVKARLREAIYGMVTNTERSKFAPTFIDDKVLRENFATAQRIAAANFVALSLDDQNTLVAEFTP